MSNGSLKDDLKLFLENSYEDSASFKLDDNKNT